MNDYQRDALRRTAVTRLKMRLSVLKPLAFWLIDCLLWVLLYQFLATLRNGYMWPPAGTLISIWFAGLILHGIYVLLRYLWEFFVRREMRHLKRQQNSGLSIAKGKRGVRLVNDGELAADSDEAEDDVSDMRIERKMRAANRLNRN